MKTKLALTNESFSFLKGSSEFLNLVLDNISSCVLLLDKEMKLVSFNDTLKTIFSNKKDEDLLYMRCGESIGCAFQIEEQKNCGETSKCNECELRISALTSYVDDEAIYKENITRPFFDFNNNKVIKQLQFSTRLFRFDRKKYILLIVDDKTDFN